MTLDKFPTTRPAFTANFARSQKLPPQVTFSRASQATAPAVPSPGTVTGPTGTFLSDYNTPRFAWKDGKCQGLLIEEGRTNSVTNSQVFQTGYTTNGITPTDNVAVAPDGTTTAASIFELGGGSASHGFFRTTTSLSGFAQSIFVKPNGRDNICLRFAVSGADNWYTITFNLTGNGSVTQEEYGSAETRTYKYKDIQHCGNGWYRISAAATTTTATTIELIVDGCTSSTPTLFTDDGAERYVGDTTLGYYVWGAQVEEGKTFPTSYIPTSGATATRAQDFAVIEPDDLNSFGYSNNVGTFVAELNVTGSAQYGRILGTGGNPAQWEFNTFAGRRINFQWINGSAAGITNIPIGDHFKISGSYELGKPVITTHSGKDAVVAGVNATSVRNVTQIRFMNGGGNSQDVTGTYSRLSYYPTYLLGEALEALTQ